MAIAAEHLTWDGDGGSELPRRPSTDDLGGDAKLDDDDFPPDDVEHPTAAGHNQIVKQLAALGRAACAAKLDVRFDSGDPYVSSVTGPRSDLEIDTFTPTDNGDGDTSIEWPANAFPAQQVRPTGLTLFQVGLINGAEAMTGYVEEITNGIRVRTFAAGSPRDIDWTIEIN